MEKLILSGSCNWCLEAIFLRVKGINSVQSGYYDISGLPFAFSKNVKENLEVVLIQYDKQIVSCESILKILFITHDPTLIKWDKNDCFYPFCRSLIAYENEKQKQQSIAFIDNIKSNYKEPIQTKITEINLNKFSKVSKSQEDYYKNNPTDAFCLSVIDPKIDKFRNSLKDLFKDI